MDGYLEEKGCCEEAFMLFLMGAESKKRKEGLLSEGEGKGRVT